MSHDMRSAGGYPSRLIAWYTVIVLLAAYTLSYMDRTIISLMVDPIKADFGLTDTQFSLLQGVAFAVMYTSFGLPMGWLVDRMSRKLIMIAGVLTWSAATIGCGMARSFGQLFGWRVMVGVGEATLTPAAESTIADLFPPDRRAGAFAVYNLGVSVGSGLALVIGGTVIHFVGSDTVTTVPLLGELNPWQYTFVVVGLPGALVALLMLTIPEPARRELYKGQVKLRSSEAWRFFGARRWLYAPFMAGAGIMAMTNAAFSAWIPAMITRTFDWPRGLVGQSYGAVTLIFGVLGAALTLTFGDRLLKRFNTKTMAAFYSVAALFQVMAALAPSPYLALACIAVPALALGATPGLSAAVLQNTTPNQFRGQFIATFLIVNALLASGLGPILPALMTDHVFGAENVRYSLATVALIFPAIAALLMLYVSRRVPAALAEAAAWRASD